LKQSRALNYHFGPDPGYLVLEWSGKPKSKHLAAYRQWALFIHQTLADRWGERILYVLGTTANQTELWSFEPGRAPKLIKKLDVGIP
jgi:hypothetical protein